MKISVILPSLNPDEKLMMVVSGLVNAGFDDIIIVNDGSDEDHMAPFREAMEYEQVTVLTHEVNKGKGRALKTAYEFCLENRKDIDGVVTVDGDNQHHVEDIRACCEALVEHPDCVVLGCRNFSQSQVPWKSRVGNNITRGVFRILCGIKISDTQTGLRAFPFQYLKLMTEISGERFEYETHVLLEMKRHKITCVEMPIETVYIEENASTHFHWLKDSLRVYGVIFKYIILSAVQFLKYTLGSILSFLIDNGLFTLMEYVLGRTVLSDWAVTAYSTVSARVVSSVFNFLFNRRAVFKSGEAVGRTLVKYYALCICQTMASAGLVYLFSRIFGAEGAWETAIKVVVDTCLFFLSFQIQKRWVFAGKTVKED